MHGPRSTETPMDDRPERTYTTGPVTAALRILGMIVTACAATTLLANYPSMPMTVPTHFNIRGEADAYGPKISVLWIVLVMVLVQTLLAWISTKPWIMNYPVGLTENNAQALYREGERLMVWVGLCVSLLFASITAAFFTTAAGLAASIAGASLVIALATGIVRLLRAPRRAAETP